MHPERCVGVYVARERTKTSVSERAQSGGPPSGGTPLAEGGGGGLLSYLGSSCIPCGPQPRLPDPTCPLPPPPFIGCPSPPQKKERGLRPLLLWGEVRIIDRGGGSRVAKMPHSCANSIVCRVIVNRWSVLHAFGCCSLDCGPMNHKSLWRWLRQVRWRCRPRCRKQDTPRPGHMGCFCAEGINWGTGCILDHEAGGGSDNRTQQSSSCRDGWGVGVGGGVGRATAGG